MKKLLFLLVLTCLFCSPVLAQDVSRVDIFAGINYTEYYDVVGVAAAVDFNLNDKFGISLDFGANETDDYGNVTFFAGPRFTLVRTEQFRVFVHGLVGGLYRGYFEETELMVTPGGGVDIPVTDWMSIRAAQLDVLLWMTPEFDSNIRYSGGIVFNLGSID